MDRIPREETEAVLGDFRSTARQVQDILRV
jgi:hypothetical protein